MQRFSAVIIGAGIAGAATAYELSRRGVADLLVLEREPEPGLHASGRNAAMARQFVPNAALLPFTAAGTRFLYDPPAEVSDRPLIRATGSLLLFAPERAAWLDSQLASAHAAGIHAERVRMAEWTARVPLSKNSTAACAVWTPTDGVVDIAAYLHGLLRATTHRGGAMITDCRIDAIERTATDFLLCTSHGEIHTPVLVNAAGAWADEVGQLAGAKPRGLVSRRRHLFVTTPMPQVDPAWPFVWDEIASLYFRPESGGLLLCACDEKIVSPDDAEIEDATVLDLLAEKFAAAYPQLANVQIAHHWCGARTFTPNGEFCMTWDPAVPRLFWITGLGGHGVTCAAAIGRAAAKQIASAI